MWRGEAVICDAFLQYLNQLENCCGLREEAILILLSDIGK